MQEITPPPKGKGIITKSVFGWGTGNIFRFNCKKPSDKDFTKVFIAAV